MHLFSVTGTQRLGGTPRPRGSGSLGTTMDLGLWTYEEQLQYKGL